MRRLPKGSSHDEGAVNGQRQDSTEREGRPPAPGGLYTASVRQSEQRPAAASAALGALAKPLWILALCALIVLLRESREALVPLALAVLLSLILSGPVEALRRLRVPRGVGALLLLLLGAAALAGAVDALSAPAQEWLQNAPRALRTIEHRVRPARSVVNHLNDLAARASAIAGADPHTVGSGPTNLTAQDLLAGTGWLAAGLTTTAALTLLLLASGPPTLARMTAALGGNWHAMQVLRTIEAIRLELARYYGTLALINLSLGVGTASLMWALHMPNPVLWGALAAVLNFVPYLGAAVTLLIVTIVALVSFDSLAHVLLVSGSFLALATIEGQIVEPVFFGRRLHLNPVIVFVALWLGGWVWGVAGVVFALPVVLALKVAALRERPDGLLVQFLGPAVSALQEKEDAPRVPATSLLSARRLRRAHTS